VTLLEITPANRYYVMQTINLDHYNIDFTGSLKRIPGIGELQYSLGLLLAEDKRLAEAVTSLRKAARLLPDRPARSLQPWTGPSAIGSA
jgi:hypothetical protein